MAKYTKYSNLKWLSTTEVFQCITDNCLFIYVLCMRACWPILEGCGTEREKVAKIKLPPAVYLQVLHV